MDIKQIQIAMVKYYNIHENDCEGKLIFVMKLDEAQIQKCQKMERISISLMNKALEYSQGKLTSPHYKIQSEMELWWIGSAQVPVESHHTLKWLFLKTNIPKVIEEQNAGEHLHVENMGNFRVEWHLSADLKALKCMFGVCGGANTSYPCLYCMASTGKENWIAQNEVGASPSRHLVDLSKYPKSLNIWEPVLPIELKNVHICTLHAELRILDKLLRLHLDYAYSIKPTKLADECIEKCENLLSNMGFHGGQVHLKKDSIQSKGTGDVLQDVSMGGAKARRFLSNHDTKQLNNMWSCWKDLCAFTTNVKSNPDVAIKRMEVWKNLDDFLKILRLQVRSKTYAEDFKKTIKLLITSIIDAWGKKDITFYLVSHISIHFSLFVFIIHLENNIL